MAYPTKGPVLKKGKYLVERLAFAWYRTATDTNKRYYDLSVIKRYMGIFKKNGSKVWQRGKISNVIYDIKMVFSVKKHTKTLSNKYLIPIFIFYQIFSDPF